MKSICFALFSILLIASSCRTTKTVAETNIPAVQPPEQNVQPVNFSDASTWLIGYFPVSRLSMEPYSEWFVKGMNGYSFNQHVIDTLKSLSKEGLSVKIVLGTWCPDSRREVPRFMRIIRETDFPEASIKFIGVDNMKFSPIDNYDQLGIERVPTFIFYRNNIETGRIIENPTTSLEQDMVNILTRNEKH